MKLLKLIFSGMLQKVLSILSEREITLPFLTFHIFGHLKISSSNVMFKYLSSTLHRNYLFIYFLTHIFYDSGLYFLIGFHFLIEFIYLFAYFSYIFIEM